MTAEDPEEVTTSTVLLTLLMCYTDEGGLKTRDWKTRHQTAGLVNAGKACRPMESQTLYFTSLHVVCNRISDRRTSTANTAEYS